jgi:hypothetical protein
MAIATDFSVAVNGDIRHVSGTAHYTVLELHRYLQDLADNAATSSDDLVDITSTTPSERSTDNIITLLGTFNIDDTAAEFFYGGSIKQGSGITETIYSGLKVLGAVNNSATQIQIIQNNSLYDATPFWGTQSTGGYNGDATAGVLLRILIKSKSLGATIDGQRVRVQARHWGDTYDFFNVTLGEGEAVAAIGTTPDAQNTSLIATVQGWVGGDIPTNVEGYQTINLNNGAGARPYYSKWTYNTNTAKLKAIWEHVKEISSQASPDADVYGVNGEMFLGITHEVGISAPSGTYVEPELVAWKTAGVTTGTGQLLAINSVTAGTTMFVQLLTGTAPTPSQTVTGNGGGSATVGTVISKTVPKVFVGSYTGTLIGAFGVGVDSDDLTASDTIQDLYGVTQTPPNNVVFTVSGLMSGEDYVLVGPKDTGNAFKFDQLTLNGALTGVVTSVVVNEAIPSDTPSSGTIRIELDTGVYRKVNYTSWVSSTFTIESTDFTDPDDAASSNNVWISYIDRLCDADSEAFTAIYSGTPRNLYVRVRDGGGTPIKTYESAASLSAAGGGAVASRIVDV